MPGTPRSRRASRTPRSRRAARTPAEPTGTARLRLELSYDGTDFAGWARQPGRRTVEGVLAEGLRLQLRLAAAPRLTVAGRTDAGVHALGQVAHVDVPAGTDAAVLGRRLNRWLPPDVRVRRAEPAPPGFDARFSAVARHYRYRLGDDVPDPLRRRDTAAHPRRLDVPAMAAAAAPLRGEHDFAAFCRARPEAGTVRVLHELAVERPAPGLVVVTAGADAFCHHMVRCLVGALAAVGDGRRPAGWPAAVLAAGRRDPGVPLMPAHGLTLVGVDYPQPGGLAEQAERSRRRRHRHRPPVLTPPTAAG